MLRWLWLALLLALTVGLAYLEGRPWPEQVWWAFLAIGIASLLGIALVPFILPGR